jgi:hypothetical protein
MITVRYSAVDGYRKTRRFKTLKGAQRWAQWRVGQFPEMGSWYAVSFDGIGKVTVEGTIGAFGEAAHRNVTLRDLFPEPESEPLPDHGDWAESARYDGDD